MAEFFSTNLGIFVIVLAQCLAVLAFVMISLLFLVYGDRKIWAAVQMRRGPNVVGVFGLLQTVADALKYVVKEIVVPAGSDKVVFLLAPITSFVVVLEMSSNQQLMIPLIAAATLGHLAARMSGAEPVFYGLARRLNAGAG